MESIKYFPIIMICKMYSLSALLVWMFMLAIELPNIISFKYKILKTSRCTEDKYLTLVWLFIPYWKAINVNIHSYEVQNAFGATSDRYYSTDITYTKEDDAIKDINEHKNTIKRNRNKWFKKKPKEKKEVRYI